MAADNKQIISDSCVETGNFRNMAFTPAWKTNLEVQEKGKGEAAKDSHREGGPINGLSLQIRRGI